MSRHAKEKKRTKTNKQNQVGLLGGADGGGGAPLAKTKLVFCNFGNTHGSRKAVWDHFCGAGAARANGGTAGWASCLVKTQKNNIAGNPHLVAYYKKVAAHKFVVAPRGNGIDTHRLWEALYLGCVPVVGKSALDGLYAEVTHQTNTERGTLSHNRPSAARERGGGNTARSRERGAAASRQQRLPPPPRRCVAGTTPGVCVLEGWRASRRGPPPVTANERDHRCGRSARGALERFGGVTRSPRVARNL